MPIFCSIENRENIIQKSKKNIKSLQFKDINVKETTTYVKPDTPLHLSTSDYAGDGFDYYVFVIDETINLVRRKTYSYQKMVFTYKSKLENNNITTLSEIKLDENNSKFLFSLDDYLDGCTADYGKEYSYKYKILNIIL